MSDDHEKVNETTKILNCGGGLNAGQSPPHPSSKKVATWTAHDKGLKNWGKGGTVVHR